MRPAAALLSVLVLLLAGCGGEDEVDDGGGATGGGGAEATDRAGFTACLADAELDLEPGRKPVTDAEGRTSAREGLNLSGAEFLGYVQWPSKRIADVYLASDAPAAEEAEAEAAEFVKAFSGDPGSFVKRQGSVVLLLDDPPPSEGEIGSALSCAG